MTTYFFNRHDNILSCTQTEGSVEVSKLVAVVLLEQTNSDFNWVVWNNTDLVRWTRV